MSENIKINIKTFALIPYTKNNKVWTFYNIPTPGYLTKPLNENAVDVKGKWIIEEDRKSEEHYRHTIRRTGLIRTTNKTDGSTEKKKTWTRQ